MGGVGPQLPPHMVEKRKRNGGDGENSDPSQASSPDNGPLPNSPKRARVVGPTLPPAPLDERPTHDPQSEENESSSDEDDGFGPSLPSQNPSSQPISRSSESTSLQEKKSIDNIAKRDDWMTMAPSNGDWSAKVDPTQLKSRKFNTGRAGRAPAAAAGGDGGSSWHETPAEKQARQQRELLGIKNDDTRHDARDGNRTGQDLDTKTAAKLKEYNEKSRGASLYESHRRTNPDAQEDDPSKRAFDREKDIGGGLGVSSTQKRDLLRKAGDFNSRFASARYL